ncbi:1-(5-phosphoribosyl)-5-[(5-phosphoribosylamino)methylideneamino]imidazole-4-carboxamide isomerase [Poritiphilus flavus]|uniref:1-(5-phosphoribosyl)-5-[(5-phosphoribosylamino)methylideneamino] imidazole-4-carboxamide isomerase n=1 Tax=Poritiphilus flavus TaxID=2697053 RepID=A0A6L9EG21_9FLAO|nr:1-(5-phosphoribosyl)-5-[(5-phosphoribosylamino)methylideneamino] imidazole-4-carboxamide isomerase [Poritiphilus flavus]NAS13623.1 1-(5-phosphoribosyl)-5-[(5-phosphoribosylamino)methylideneamino]imidazole-4-carboxamide isomerase [Poritiphilus flavus]
MRIIPAIDIIEGKCVRLSKGDYSTKKVYNENPLEVAKAYEAHGITYLHLVDLDGAKSRHIVNHKILEAISQKTNLKVDFGGGLKSDEDLKIAFDSGASQVTGGSIAVKDSQTFLGWLQNYGPERIILGADADNELVAISGWQEASEEQLIPFVKRYQKKGIQYVICTDISKDGMLEGPSFDLYTKLLKQTAVVKTEITSSGVQDKEVPGIKLIASGGISDIGELPQLQRMGCEGVIIGKAIYEDKISLKQLEQYIIGQ